MASSGYIHGGSDLREVERLERQSFFVAPQTFKHFDAAPGMKVLDLATGVGAMADQLVRHFPGIALTGLDLRAAQLEHARNRHPVATYVEGDASKMPFADGSFDRVHCSGLLEHVSDPVSILREVRRVLKPGGYCHFIEVDNASFSTTPSIPEVVDTFAALDREQRASGGDPDVGPKLKGLFEQAGFSQVRIFSNAMRGNASDPAFFHAFLVEFAEIFESLDEALGPSALATAQRAAQQLRALEGTPGGEIRYTPWIAQGSR